MKLLGFDIEISDIFDLKPGEDLDQYAPFHISVAATAVWEGEEKLWYSEHNGVPLPSMTKEDSYALLCYLRQMQENGYALCAWNGLSFDLRWIGWNAADMALATKVALDLFDPMFQFFNEKSFPISLASVAKGLDIKQSKLMSGADAPKIWAEGDYQRVMDYVMGDATLTNQVILRILETKTISWVTRRGALQHLPTPFLHPVWEILEDPEPVPPVWMTNPMRRSKFTDWMLPYL